GILIINLLFIILFYKELKLATFDTGLAAALGFSPTLIHYALMTLVSVTAVGAFEAVGSILVVALMITPPATAYLLTNRLSLMIVLSAIFGVLGAIGGFWAAYLFDTSIAGSMATMVGIFFVIAFLMAPNRGIIAIIRRRSRQKLEFAETMLVIHLFNHADLPEAVEECKVDHLDYHMRWDNEFANKIVKRSLHNKLINQSGDMLLLTDSGKEKAMKALEH
ncbi:MAG: metal ABC transporter permease, partial [candidate division Zixibacteria bacterium]|nr:metal ABC transporter permease [candidate division Zixibacteria bacterium]